MRLLLIPLTIMMSFQSFAGMGSSLIAARDAAIAEATVEIDIDEVLAFEILPSAGDEVAVDFLIPTGIFSLECHFHGNAMACHEEGGHKILKEEAGFDHITEGHDAGLAKLEKTLRRRNLDLNSLKSIKVWKLESNGGGNGHDHGDDVWTKVTYDVNNKEVTVFIGCNR